MWLWNWALGVGGGEWRMGVCIPQTLSVLCPYLQDSGTPWPGLEGAVVQ